MKNKNKLGLLLFIIGVTYITHSPNESVYVLGYIVTLLGGVLFLIEYD